ncbi:MAG: hypothetical protein AUK47_12745 [Deltaproteobacteria bacterium CG2_30_63_29]|nr:MAG: hypothetical protein AUK47_12745 [Deltaproteobacteria bacterium CG2_30_63_29]
MRTLKRITLFGLGLAVGVCVVIFISRNPEPVVVRYFFGRTGAVPLWSVAMAAFLMGMLVPVALYFVGLLEFFLDHRRARKRIEVLEKELVELRNLPLTEAQIDIERPRPKVRAIIEERTPLLEAELLPANEEIKEADLYPAVYDKRGG